MNILIIEDDDFKLVSIKKILSQLFIDVNYMETRSLKDSIDEIKNNEYDLIIVDMAIPAHTVELGGAPTVSFVVGGLDIIIELDLMGRKDPCIVLTQYHRIEIEKQFFPIKKSKQKIKELLGCDVLDCIEYNQDSKDWQEKLIKLIRNNFKINKKQ